MLLTEPIFLSKFQKNGAKAILMFEKIAEYKLKFMISESRLVCGKKWKIKNETRVAELTFRILLMNLHQNNCEKKLFCERKSTAQRREAAVERHEMCNKDDIWSVSSSSEQNCLVFTCLQISRDMKNFIKNRGSL